MNYAENRKTIYEKGLLTQPIHNVDSCMDIEDIIDCDLDFYHEFLLKEFGLNHEDNGHKEEVDHLVHVLKKYDSYVFKLGNEKWQKINAVVSSVNHYQS